MPVISCRSGTALLIYFKVSFRTVWLITTLHGAVFPKVGKALLGKLVCVFFLSSGSDTLCFIPLRLGKGRVHTKQAGWWDEDEAAAILPPPCRCCGTHSSMFRMLWRVAGTREASIAAKNCGDSMCLTPAFRLRELVKGITNLRHAAFAPCSLHICLIPSEVSAAQGYDMFLGRAVNGKKGHSINHLVV